MSEKEEPCVIGNQKAAEHADELLAMCRKYAETLAFTGLFPADLAAVRNLIARVDGK